MIAEIHHNKQQATWELNVCFFRDKRLPLRELYKHNSQPEKKRKIEGEKVITFSFNDCKSAKAKHDWFVEYENKKGGQNRPSI